MTGSGTIWTECGDGPLHSKLSDHKRAIKGYSARRNFVPQLRGARNTEKKESNSLLIKIFLNSKT